MIKYSNEIKSMNLWEKISQISSEVEYLQKDDKVGFGNNQYKAISIEKVVTAVSDKLNKYGVVIYPSKQNYVRKDEEVVKKDGTVGINRISDVDVEYTVINIHNPQEVFITVSSGCGVDTQDKGIGKAMTYAYKNMIIKVFNIATGDDTDKVHSDDYTKKLYEGTSTQREAAADKVTNFKLTSKQLANILTIGLKAGFKEADILKVIKHDYNKNAILELSKSEYDAICKRLEDKTNKDK